MFIERVRTLKKLKENEERGIASARTRTEALEKYGDCYKLQPVEGGWHKFTTFNEYYIWKNQK